jgi:hypothetical protein
VASNATFATAARESETPSVEDPRMLPYSFPLHFPRLPALPPRGAPDAVGNA